MYITTDKVEKGKIVDEMQKVFMLQPELPFQSCRLQT